jgi:hypothetical protein
MPINKLGYWFFAVLVVGMVTVVMWYQYTHAAPTGMVVTETIPEAPEGTVLVDKERYAKDDIVKITVQNTQSKFICFEVCNPFYLEDKSKAGWHTYYKTNCEEYMVQDCIRPGAKKSYERRITTGSLSLPSGTYRVTVPLCIDCIHTDTLIFREDARAHSPAFKVG